MGIKCRSSDGVSSSKYSIDIGKELNGEDLSGTKRSAKQTLVKEITDNAFQEDVEVEIISDPKTWGETYQVAYLEASLAATKKRSKEFWDKMHRIVKRAYKWVRDAEEANKLTSMVQIRAALGINGATWNNYVHKSEEFKHYHDLINELLTSRVISSGINESGNQVFKIFMVKNQLPDEYADKKENINVNKIEVIQIGEGSKEEIAKSIEENTKRLNK